MKTVDYEALSAQACALIHEVPHFVSNLANLSALLFHSLEKLNWAGFYLLEGELLVLGPFQGKPACIEIPLGKGVCGTAAREGRTIVVPDVHQFEGHIACDSDSASEIVIPFHRGGKLIGVLDIDSPIKARFDEGDRRGLEGFVRAVEAEI
ncbi:MAG: GAF domain-containing protein, partial [Clostridia bacterium]|nr:GAF domain-containing protein [Clostridia bacterium]